jgi:hypothetical protein
MRILNILFLVTFCFNAFTQTGKMNFKKAFTEAETYFLYQDYKDALYLYKILANEFENNPKYIYRQGQCYLNIPGSKNKSIAYLEKAYKHADPFCKVESFKESCVPYDVFIDLAEAYRVNYQFDDAITLYANFLQIMDTSIFDKNIILEEIESCKFAKQQVNSPREVKFTEFDKEVNINNYNFRPVISSDGNTMMFVSKLKFYDAVYFTKKDKNGEWSKPENIIPQIRIDNNIYPTSLNSDGTKALFVYYGDLDGNVFSSDFDEKTDQWNPAEKLNRYINTEYWESHASFSEDDKSIYFTSNREGGFGGLDIYKSELDNNGDWGEPVNLGSVINSRFDEQSPVEREGKLFFSSNGHNTMGGYDFFISVKNQNSWTTPINLGYPINTPDDEINIYPAENSKKVLLSKFDDKASKESIVFTILE